MREKPHPVKPPASLAWLTCRPMPDHLIAAVAAALNRPGSLASQISVQEFQQQIHSSPSSLIPSSSSAANDASDQRTGAEVLPRPWAAPRERAGSGRSVPPVPCHCAALPLPHPPPFPTVGKSAPRHSRASFPWCAESQVSPGASRRGARQKPRSSPPSGSGLLRQ